MPSVFETLVQFLAPKKNKTKKRLSSHLVWPWTKVLKDLCVK